MNTLPRDHDLKPEGRCILVVDRVSQINDQLVWQFIVKEGACRGADLQYCTSLNTSHLWKLRNLLEAIGIEVIDGQMDIDLSELADLPVGGVISNRQITDFWPIEDYNNPWGRVDNIIPFPRRRA
jgi:hypothetical protein